MQKKQLPGSSPRRFRADPNRNPSIKTLQMKTFATSSNLECQIISIHLFHESPTNYTTWGVERVELSIDKANTPPTKEFPPTPIMKIATLLLASTFVDMLSLHVYHRIQKRCAYSNYDAIPNISEKEKRSPSLILGQPV